jgi:hypothetical protein
VIVSSSCRMAVVTSLRRVRQSSNPRVCALCGSPGDQGGARHRANTANMPILELLPSTCRHRAELALASQPAAFGCRAGLAGDSTFLRQSACGRSANMLLAILVYLIYNNLVTISQGWVANGKVSFAVGVMAVHLAHAVSPADPVLPSYCGIVFPAAISMKIYRRYLAREVSAPYCWSCWRSWRLFAFFDMLGESRISAREATSSSHALGSSCCACRGVSMN